MRNRYEEQLRLLNSELAEMGAVCEEAINCAAKYLTDNNIDMKKKAQEAEKQTDRMERDIEGLCMRLLMHQQPLAADFRLVTAALKMISDMERIGDHAEDIVEIGEYIVKADISVRKNISEIAAASARMLKTSVDSYVKKSTELASEAIKMDDKVDELFTELKRKLLDLVIKDKENAEALLDFLMIAKYFERIGDHSENIAEWVIYALTGTHKN